MNLMILVEKVETKVNWNENKSNTFSLGRENQNIPKFGRESREIPKLDRDGRNIPIFGRGI